MFLKRHSWQSSKSMIRIELTLWRPGETNTLPWSGYRIKWVSHTCAGAKFWVHHNTQLMWLPRILYSLNAVKDGEGIAQPPQRPLYRHLFLYLKYCSILYNIISIFFASLCFLLSLKGYRKPSRNRQWVKKNIMMTKVIANVQSYTTDM